MTLDDVYDELLQIVSDVGASLTVPIESEEFFSEIVEHFTGTKEDLLLFIQSNIKSWFVFVHSEPNWIQNPEWKFFNGKPMVFVGQIPISKEQGLFHDDASFYVFWDPKTGVTDTLIQVA